MADLTGGPRRASDSEDAGGTAYLGDRGVELRSRELDRHDPTLPRVRPSQRGREQSVDYCEVGTQSPCHDACPSPRSPSSWPAPASPRSRTPLRGAAGPERGTEPHSTPRRDPGRAGPRPTRPASARPTDRQSRVWFTLQGGRVSEVFYPDLSTPSMRSLELTVIDGDHADRQSRDMTTVVTQAGRAQPAVHPGEHRQRGPLPAHRGGRHRPGPQRGRHPRERRVPGRRQAHARRPLRARAGQRHRQDHLRSTKRSLKAVDHEARVASTLVSSPRLVDTSHEQAYIQEQQRHDQPRLRPDARSSRHRRPSRRWASRGARRRAVRRRLARLPGRAQAGARQREQHPASVPRLGAGPRRRRGQGEPGRVRREPVGALGVGRRGQGPQLSVRVLPRGLVARPLPDRHRPLRHGRRGRGPARSPMAVPHPAEEGRLVPAELRRRRHRGVDRAPARPGHPADRAGAPGRPDRQADLQGHQEGSPLPHEVPRRGDATRRRRSRPRSAGRTSPATHRPPSPPRSTAWSPARRSLASTATAGWPASGRRWPTAGPARSRAGR